MFHFLVWALLLQMGGTQTGGNAEIKIVRRNTFGGHSSESRTYIMGDRRRVEMTHAVQRRKEEGSVE